MSKVDWEQNDYEKSSGFDTLPKGRYLAVVADSEDKQTKDKTGRYLEFEFVVVAPKEFKNRKLWARLNVHNKSEVAQRIGREQFNSLADCCGMMGKVQKTEQLHDKQVILLVGIRPATAENKEQNEINGFQKYEGPAATARPAGAPAAAKKEEKPAARPAAAFNPDDDDIPF